MPTLSVLSFPRRFWVLGPKLHMRAIHHFLEIPPSRRNERSAKRIYRHGAEGMAVDEV